MTRRVTLLTDFGTADGFVGAMKGVIASAAPDSLIDDVAHDIPPGDIVSASYALLRYWRLYPEATVHLVVVDPGVGTARRALAFQVDGRFLVCPDNGCASRVLDDAASWRAVDLSAVKTPDAVRTGRSRTFHGRDVFAPAAGRLAAGGALEDLGLPVDDPVRIPEPAAARSGRSAAGVVVALDRFGNLLTNVPGDWLGVGARVEIAGRVLPVGETYADVGEGELVGLVSSDGRLEIALRGGSAAERLGVGRGEVVKITG
jgi:S-adenosyl-L-methionine hydrolase (adenosine-forming)